MECSLNINGIDVNAFYSDKTVEELFVPLLKHLSELSAAKKNRILVLLAAPPGAGKSTLVSFLEVLAKDVLSERSLQAIGMDGFHRRQEYLMSHTANVDGKELPMVAIKGAPITFDLDALQKKIVDLIEEPVCTWPVYDRLLHNPVEDAITVDGEIVLLEGNYLLQDLDGWRELSSYADYTISLSADEELLRERLVSRRVATGVKREDAEKFVDFSDMANVQLCLEKTIKADLELELAKDGTEIVRKER